MQQFSASCARAPFCETGSASKGRNAGGGVGAGYAPARGGVASKGAITLNLGYVSSAWP